MQKSDKRAGYVLVLALMIITGMTALVTRVISKVNARYQQSTVFAKTMQAQTLALSGIEIAKSMLTPDQKEKKQNPNELATNNIKRLLEHINTWHTITLTEKADGVDGQIRLYIACESGKIPVNTLFDFKKKQYKKNAQKVLNQFSKPATQNIEDSNFTQDLKQLFMQQKKPLLSISQIANNKKYKKICDRLFSSPEQDISLTDIFTTEPDCTKIQPLLLSTSIQKILKLNNQITASKDQKQKMAVIEKAIKKIPEQAQWPKDWNIYAKPLYQKNLKQIPNELQQLFDNKIGADVFSVVCYGSIGSTKLGSTTQKVYAILEKGERRISEKENQVIFTIRKLYWL